MDPEVPVVSVVDLGIVRAVRVQGTAVEVVLTPTYSGCPATEVIAHDISQALHSHGLQVQLRTQLAPPWTSDWMSERARHALRAYGIAPPVHLSSAAQGMQVVHLHPAGSAGVAVPCPLCGSAQTRLLSQFGSTACKALYRCNTCLEPFDYFKPH